MNKQMIHRFFLLHTKDTPICQISASTLQMIQGDNFIQVSIPQKRTSARNANNWEVNQLIELLTKLNQVLSI